MTNREWLDKVRANEQVLISLIVRSETKQKTARSVLSKMLWRLETSTPSNSLLSAAWFGVPESTSCWQIKGFKEAVDLLDDPAEMENEDENEEGDEQ